MFGDVLLGGYFEELPNMWVFVVGVGDLASQLLTKDKLGFSGGVVGEGVEWGCVGVHGEGRVVGLRLPWWRHNGLSGKFDKP